MGTIRLRPRTIDGEYCWFGTALTGIRCHEGIPLAIPETLLQKQDLKWGDKANITGRIRFLQDAGLGDVAGSVYGTRPLILFVESLKVVQRAKPGPHKIILTPVVLFDIERQYDTERYAFVQCMAGSDQYLDKAAAWIDAYAHKHSGHVITNFDEQRPLLANAPLSYQKLVAKTFDKQIINNFAEKVVVQRIGKLVQETKTFNVGEFTVGYKVTAGGSVIFAKNSTLTNVNIAAGQGLDSAQKAELEKMIQSLRAELEAIKSTHPDEVIAITEAVEKAVSNASKPPEERKKNMLQLSVKGLKDAAETVADIAPGILATAGMIAKFVVGLS